MSLYQVQKLLFNIHNNLTLRAEYQSSPDTVLAGYQLSDVERRALADKDMAALYRMGVNPWLLLQYAHISGVDTRDYLAQIRGA